MTSRVVLYIDDNEDNIRLVERVIKRLPGIELRTAATARDGIKAAADGRQPDLILLDNRLPDADGHEVLLELTARPATAAIPVVMLSGDADPEVIKNLRAAGAVDYLVKPFDIHQLISVIRRYLG
jgi:CheY-like chemotaxis protein